MRSDYHAHLRQLAELLHAMSERDRVAIAAATHAVVNADIDQAEATLDLVGQVEAMQREAEQEALRLLALQAPVAGELRQVVAAIQLTGNPHRMAVLAGHIATSARRRHPDHVVPEPVRPLIERIGSTALVIATSAASVLDTGDPDAAGHLPTCDAPCPGRQATAFHGEEGPARADRTLARCPRVYMYGQWSASR